MPRLDERRRGEPFDVVRCADRRLARKPTVEELDDRAPFDCSVPSPASEQNSTGDCHAAEFQNLDFPHGGRTSASAECRQLLVQEFG